MPPRQRLSSSFVNVDFMERIWTSLTLFRPKAAVRLIEVIFSNHASRERTSQRRFDLTGGKEAHLALKLAHYGYVLETGEVVTRSCWPARSCARPT